MANPAKIMKLALMKPMTEQRRTHGFVPAKDCRTEGVSGLDGEADG